MSSCRCSLTEELCCGRLYGRKKKRYSVLAPRAGQQGAQLLLQRELQEADQQGVCGFVRQGPPAGLQRETG